jgi:putative hemolysin
MGKSKVRGGAKAHRKRVENRNQTIKTQQSAIQKLFNETMKLQMEEFKKKQEPEQNGTSETQQ